MHKIFSKIKKNKLLHIFYKYKKNINRVNLSPNKEFLQASIIRFKNKKKINSHNHLKHDLFKNKRQIQESWILIKGEAKITYYDTNKKKIKKFAMKPGDISITFYGGHELEIIKKNSILYEYKTGPYKGNSKDLKYFTKSKL
tara:strand:- start:2153 stop:2578 length:426 start_codon:yes stop_codon:yes gene_type:complete